MPAVMETTRRGFAQQEEVYAPLDSHSPEWEAEFGSLSQPHGVSMWSAFKGKVEMKADFDVPIKDFTC